MIDQTWPGACGRTYLKNAVNPDYWRELNRDFAISEGLGQSVRPICPNREELQYLEDGLKVDGYFQTNPILPAGEIQTLREGVEKLKEADWLPVFGFVYDEFWQIRARLSFILAKILGENYQQLPDFWAWYVDRSPSSQGWKPHRDRPADAVREDGTPNSLTMWIALTDATTLNGCMYVLPSAVDRKCDVWFKALIENIQGVRALPADAGSVIGWKQNLLHWGGQSCERAPHPRISLGFEFQRGDIQPYNNPLLDPLAMPTFEQRLGLIGKQILQYLHMYQEHSGTATSELVQFAEELMKCRSGGPVTSKRQLETFAHL